MRANGLTLLILIILFFISCSSLITPIASNNVQSTYNNIGEYLSSQSCTQAISLVGEKLTLTRTKWNPNISLQSGSEFLSSFKLRYGIDYKDRRSPVEVETLIEVYEKVRAEIEKNPELLNLPLNYHLSEQDKTDLFYVSRSGSKLAIREILEPLLVKEIVLIIPVEPTPIAPTIDPPIDLIDTCPECPQTVICPKFTISSDALMTLDKVQSWVIGSGRRAKVKQMVNEIKFNIRSTGQVNVVVIKGER